MVGVEAAVREAGYKMKRPLLCVLRGNFYWRQRDTASGRSHEAVFLCQHLRTLF